MVAVRPGDRVRVANPRTEPCHLHALAAVPVRGVDEGLGEHCVVVVFDLWHQGTRWTDRFRPSELAPA